MPYTGHSVSSSRINTLRCSAVVPYDHHIEYPVKSHFHTLCNQWKLPIGLKCVLDWVLVGWTLECAAWRVVYSPIGFSDCSGLQFSSVICGVRYIALTSQNFIVPCCTARAPLKCCVPRHEYEKGSIQYFGSLCSVSSLHLPQVLWKHKSEYLGAW